jgi:hypothetical protein
VPAFPYEALLAPVKQIDGFALACLIDASTGMILGSVQDDERLNLPVAAAGAADVAGVLSAMTAALAVGDDVEDVIVTLSSYYHLIRLLQLSRGPQLLLLVTLDRAQANLGMAHHEIRHFSVSAAS